VPTTLLKLSPGDTLGDVDDRLRTALDTAGFTERRYYGFADDGLVVVTRTEAIRPDGSPQPPPGRWTSEPGFGGPFNLVAYLRALITAPAGDYRVFAFVVSARSIRPAAASREDRAVVEGLGEGGALSVPAAIRVRPVSAQTRCTLLVYVLRKRAGSEATLVAPSPIQGQEHLRRSGVLDALEAAP